MTDIKSLIETLTPIAVSLAGKIISAVLILTIGFSLAKILVKMFTKSKAFAKLDPGVSSFLKNFLSIGMKVLVIVTVAAVIGIPMTSFITILGSMAVAIGLSLQGSLSNIAGGLLILLTKPFVIGDFISVSGFDGTVADIGLFYTKLTTGDNRKVVLPNSVVSNNALVNVTEQKTRRIDLEITVDYNSDIEKVKGILLSVANAHDLVLKDPAPLARLSAHGDSALVFVYRTWCNKDDYWTVRFDLLETVKAEFDKEGISIPFPQLDVHLDK